MVPLPNRINQLAIECHSDFVNVDILIKIDIFFPSKWNQYRDCIIISSFTCLYIYVKCMRLLLHCFVNIGLEEFMSFESSCVFSTVTDAHFCTESPVILMHHLGYTSNCYYRSDVFCESHFLDQTSNLCFLVPLAQISTTTSHFVALKLSSNQYLMYLEVPWHLIHPNWLYSIGCAVGIVGDKHK